MKNGIWLEVSRVRIQVEEVHVQVQGDKGEEDKPEWWQVQDGATGEDSWMRTYHAIAKGLDNAEQMVIARLQCVMSPDAKAGREKVPDTNVPDTNAPDANAPDASAKKAHALVCTAIRIQTHQP